MINRLRHLNDDEGISLVEVVVATAVLMVVISATASALIGSTASVRDTRDRTVATNLASARIEVLQGTPFADLVLGSQVDTVRVGPTNFTVITEMQLVPVNATTSSCSAAGSEPPAYVDTAVTVEWEGMRGGPATSRTLITPDVGAIDPYRGQIAVIVRDREGRGVPFMPVVIDRVDGAGLDVQTTDREGCAFFINVAPGAWDVVVDEEGWVDQNGVQRTIQQTSVLASQTKRAEFMYDRAGSLQVRPVAGDDPTVGAVAAEAMSLTLEHTYFDESDGRRVLEGVGYPREIQGLFPHQAPYGLHAGRCFSAAPVNHGAISSFRAAVDPAEETSVDLPMHVVSIRNPRPTAIAVTATMQDLGAGCTEVLDLGSIPADSTTRFLLPYGVWTIAADGGTREITNTDETLPTALSLELTASGLQEVSP